MFALGSARRSAAVASTLLRSAVRTHETGELKLCTRLLSVLLPSDTQQQCIRGVSGPLHPEIIPVRNCSRTFGSGAAALRAEADVPGRSDAFRFVGPDEDETEESSAEDDYVVFSDQEIEDGFTQKATEEDMVNLRNSLRDTIREAAADKFPRFQYAKNVTRTVIRLIHRNQLQEIVDKYPNLPLSEQSVKDGQIVKHHVVEDLINFLQVDTRKLESRGRPLGATNSKRAQVNNLTDDQGRELDQWGNPKLGSNSLAMMSPGDEAVFSNAHGDEYGPYPLQDRSVSVDEEEVTPPGQAASGPTTPIIADGSPDGREGLLSGEGEAGKVSIAHVHVGTDLDTRLRQQKLTPEQEAQAEERKKFIDSLKPATSGRRASKLLQMAMGQPSDARLYAFAVSPEEVASLLHTTQIQDVTIMHFDPQEASFTNAFVFGTGRSPRHLYSAANAVTYLVKQRCRDANWQGPTCTMDGVHGSTWIAVDAGSVGIHLMTQEEREFRDLEGYWIPKALKVERLPNPERPDTVQTARPIFRPTPKNEGWIEKEPTSNVP